ncbi:MDR family MFS transporter [Enterococcus nangangensis]|uniref:MDR family MFS transporter n=1 Tax=Enterococcus nangangensis TaxID=2559926 RepID=UPI001FE30B2D|nr:MFS transporter [Enterococcus nangangensis]
MMWQELHPNIRKRIMIQFLSRFGSSLIFPFMAIYFTQAYSAKIAGVLVMINVVVSFLAGIYGGHLTDLIGRRKMLVAGELLKVGTTAGILLANSPWWQAPAFTFAMMLLQNLASGLINPASEAMLVDVSNEKNRSFMYAISYWASNLSLMLGIMVGGWFFEEHLFPLISGLMIINLLTTALTYRFIQETHAPEKKLSQSRLGLKGVWQSYRQVCLDQRFFWFTVSGVLILGIEYQRNNYISVHLSQNFLATTFFNLPLNGVKMLSLSTTLNTLLVVLLTAPIAQWLISKKIMPTFKIGVALFASGFALLAFSLNFWFILGATIVLSLGELLYVPTRQAKLAELVAENNRGAYLAVNGTIFQLGKLVAASMLIFSPYVGRIGMLIAILLLGICAISLATFSLTLTKNK